MKKNRLIFICTILCVLFSMHINAQVWNGDLTFSNQAEIDDFSNAPYTSVNGNLIIRDDIDGQHNITNLAGLAGLTAVTGVVNIIFNNVLPNTVFLNLQSIGVELRMGVYITAVF